MDIQIQTVELQKRISPNGYISINLDGEWILEHKYIVECHIGRKLTREEVIHHINSNKQDNRIQNLMIFKNQTDHAKFHLKVRQFGITNPIIREINTRWDEYFKD